MSGKPNRYPSDPTKYKGQYMEALELRANIDDMNLQANKTYKATGQLPPVSQMPETRTTSEILADNERLKIELIKDLAPVGDSHFAQAVIQRIQNSRLNTTGSLFTYFAQRAPEIVIQIKKLYKYKIKGDSNDVETMASFVEDMFAKTRAMTSSVSSFFTQTENKKHAMNKLKDLEDIYSLFKDIARRLLLKAKPSSTIGKMCNDIASGLQLYTNFLSNDQINKIVMMMSNENAQGYAYKIGEDNKNRLDEYYDVFKRYNEIIEQFPSSDILYTLLQQLEQTIINKNDDLTNRLLTEFLGLLNMIDEVKDLISELRKISSDLHRYYVPPRDLDEEAAEAYFNDPNNPRHTFDDDDDDDEGGGGGGPSAPSISFNLNDSLNQKILGLNETIKKNEEKLKKLNKQLDDLTLRENNDDDVNKYNRLTELISKYNDKIKKDKKLIKLLSKELKESPNIPVNQQTNQQAPPPQSQPDYNNDERDEGGGGGGPSIPSRPSGLSGPGPKQTELLKQIDDEYNIITELNYQITHNLETLNKIRNQPKSKTNDKAIKAVTERIEQYHKGIQMHKQTIQELKDKLKDATASGSGFKKGRGRPRGCGIVKQKPYSESVKAHVSYDKGIMESPRFVKFGKYLINNHKLNNDDIFALKQPSGGALQEFPSVRLSKQLSNVIKKMVGGGVPSYNDLNGLSEPEKAYLHKVSTRSNIVDKFSIPAPNKDQYEKDIHEFEVLKGEIMAGNDSKELIKKFKLHLMKLSKMGSLPKREVSEVMEELLQMGY